MLLVSQIGLSSDIHTCIRIAAASAGMVAHERMHLMHDAMGAAWDHVQTVRENGRLHRGQWPSVATVDALPSHRKMARAALLGEHGVGDVTWERARGF